MVTLLIIIQLSTAPYTPPPKPKELPEPMPAMYARNIEIAEEIKRTSGGKVRIFTLRPHTDEVILVQERRLKPSTAQKPWFAQGNYAGTKYNRRGTRNK